MKRTFLYIALMLGLAVWAMPQTAMADDAPTAQESKTKKKSKKTSKKKKKNADKEEAAEEAPAELSPVAALLENCEYLTNARPNLKAQYFIILSSASWCGPCNKEMPSVAKNYEEMKRSGLVELILDSRDNTPEAAVGFVNKYGATFPVLAKGTLPAGIKVAPSPGIPWASILNADNTLITSGHGGIIAQWKQHTIKDTPIPDAPAEDAEADEDAEPAMYEAIADAKFFNAKPLKKAEYYIYLHSASWCGPCKRIMPEIVKEYKKMRKAKVEVILMGHDKTQDAAKAYLKSYKAKFPAMMDGEKARKMPGYMAAAGIPFAVIVDKNGKVITSGHGSIALEWKEHCK